MRTGEREKGRKGGEDAITDLLLLEGRLLLLLLLLRSLVESKRARIDVT